MREAVDDTERIFKYLIYLLYSLRNNEISLIMLLNSLCNYLIIRNLEHPAQVLLFLMAFRAQTAEHSEMAK